MAWPTDGRHPESKSNLRDGVLSTYGIDQDQDAELRGVADRLIDQTIKDMNSHLYEFNKFKQEGIALVENQKDYELENTTPGPGGGSVAVTPMIPYKEVIGYLVKTDGVRLPLTYIPWVRFSDQLGQSLFGNTGIPSTYSWNNIEADGKVSLYPTPNGGAQTDYTLTIEFYRRIPLFSEVMSSEQTIAVPEEVEVPLVYGACKRLAIHLLGAAHPDVAAFHRLEKDSLAELKAVDKRHPDQRQRFRLSDNISRNRTVGRRQLFIKI